jgi:hypothetical protein
MYEMEGASPGYVAPGSPVARLTRHYAPPAGTGNPRDVPVSRYFPRPGVAPRRFPFPTVKVFLLLSPAVAQEPAGIHCKFFGVHMISTEYRRLSARYSGYPPAYAQLIHRLPNVIHRTLIQQSLNVIRRSFAATSG